MSSPTVAHVAAILRRHGVDARDQDPCISIAIEDDVHISFNLEKLFVSIYDVAHDVHLTYPLSVRPPGMADYEYWLRELTSARETWRRVCAALPSWLRERDDA